MNLNKILFLVAFISIGRFLAVYSLDMFSKSAWSTKRSVYEPRVIPHRSQVNQLYLIGLLAEAILLVLLIKSSLIHFKQSTVWGALLLLLSFMFVVEPLYYFYHRLLHTRFLYKHHHIHHHKATVPTPLAAFYFTFTERLSYTVLFAIPLLLVSALDLLSVPLLIIYIVSFDFLNALGHTNTRLFSDKYKQSIRHLFLYSPDFHSDHHKYFHTNYSLFMPLWDKLFKTYRS